MTIELIYTSIPAHNDPDVDSILEISRRKNSDKGITGLLCYDGIRFLQILEGEEHDIERLYTSIEADGRHREVDILYTGKTRERSFESW